MVTRSVHDAQMANQYNSGSARLCTLMQDMTAKDSEALFVFVQEFQSELSKTIRSILGSVGRRDVSSKAAEVDFLVLSAALVIFDRAARWQPGGAPPWVWANRPIRAEVVRWLGHPRVEFEAELHASTPTVLPVVTSDINYEVVAAQCEEVAAWLTEVRLVASERDQRVHIEYQTQKSLGDPSPAHTVAAEFGLQPANVRQIDARVRRRLTSTAMPASS